MQTIIAIDPGTHASAFVIWTGGAITGCDIVPNHELIRVLNNNANEHTLVAIEMVACYGMPVGKETFETCLWIGRYVQVAEQERAPVRLVYRNEVKTHLCHSARAKDSNIRQALIDRLGQCGTKKQPGPLYGIASHKWAALAVAIYVQDNP